eukprot:TRINITY_DN68093_c0_g1_i1.p1 TRINITY_DN68093_c0_g1~~TRINITY_DN68093_c0_g1_i1.p1  ORF type:complete len:220 (-),score=36.96 TRINITY_DN68093_c0_g1_i1:398-1057(-)
MGAKLSAADRGITPSDDTEYDRARTNMEEEKREGRFTVPVVAEKDWTEDLLLEVENPSDWSHVKDADWRFAFLYPSSWELCDPILEGYRYTRTVRVGYRHSAGHIFNVCELSIVVHKVGPQIQDRDAFFAEIRKANRASCPSNNQESFGTLDGHTALMTSNTYRQEDETLTRVIDKHCFIPKLKMGYSLVAFFADKDLYFNKFHAVANRFFQSVTVADS